MSTGTEQRRSAREGQKRKLPVGKYASAEQGHKLRCRIWSPVFFFFSQEVTYALPSADCRIECCVVIGEAWKARVRSGKQGSFSCYFLARPTFRKLGQLLINPPTIMNHNDLYMNTGIYLVWACWITNCSCVGCERVHLATICVGHMSLWLN